VIGGHEPLAKAGAVVRQLSRLGIRVHVPVRADWSCSACGLPWPCPPARLTILESSGGRVDLSITMVRVLEAAVQDLPEVDPKLLYDRMLRWTR
jgi:hypothetical protein